MAEQETLQKKETENVERAERTRPGRVFAPATDIFETKEEIILMADMPGVDEGSIDITLEQDVLTIQGQVEREEFEGFSSDYVEYEVGDYYRSFTLNDVIDRDKIAANLKNGVLTVKLPKAEPAKPKKINVKVE